MRGLEASDRFTMNPFEKIGHEVSVLRLIGIILFRRIIPDKAFVKDEGCEDMNIMRPFRGTLNINDFTQPFYGGILIEDVFDKIYESRELHKGEGCFPLKERV